MEQKGLDFGATERVLPGKRRALSVTELTDRLQIRAVVWKTAARLIKWKPKDGMRVLARGGIKVYAPRGDYQISVEVLEPLGVGSLQQAFEELKDKLSKEGLFDPARKRPLP